MMKFKKKSALKNAVVFLTIGIYLTLSNFCFAYAVVTGDFHHPFNSSTEVSHKHNHTDHHCVPTSHDHHDHDSTSNHEHGSSNDSDKCCVTFSKDLPAIVQQSQIPIKPSKWIVSFVAVPSQPLTGLVPSHTDSNNHDPPLIFSSNYNFSLLSPRAPPVS